MEEFTDNGQASRNNEIILPAEKKLTLTPIHDDVREDDISDAQVAASHANGSPIANIASDVETTGDTTTEHSAAAPAPDTYTPPKPAPHITANRHPYRTIVIMAVIVVLLLAVLLIR